jgi:ABC-type multidrug transport system fused ATPase/permease subunit
MTSTQALVQRLCSPSLADLLRRTLQRSWRLAAYVLSLAVAGGLTSLRFLLLGRLVQAGLSDERDALGPLFAATVTVWILSQLAEYANMTIGLLFERSLAISVVRAKVEAILEARRGGTRPISAHHAAHLLRTGLTVLGRTLRSALGAVQRFALALVTVATAFFVEPILASCCVGTVALVLAGTCRLIPQQRRGATAALEAQQELHAHLCRLFAALPQMKLYGAGQQQLEKLSVPLARFLRGEQASLQAQRRATLETSLASGATGVVLLALGMELCRWGLTTFAELATLLVLQQSLFLGMRQAFQQWSAAEENSDYLSQLLQQNAAAETEPVRGRPLAGPIISIVCQEASFAISDTVLLRGVTCQLQRGQLYGVVGPSGSGKTMLLHLLSGQAQPYAGRLLYNDIPVEEIAVEDLWPRVALATWPPLIFDGTLEENLRVVRTDASGEQLQQALGMAALDRDVAQLQPAGGLQARVGRKGVLLSVGQLQRLALARAFLREPEVLLVDDLLSGLDPETAERVLHSLRGFARGRIVVFVVPGPRALPFCDQVLLTEAGRFAGQVWPEAVLDHPAGKEALRSQRGQAQAA